MNYTGWLSDWPFLFAAISIPVLLVLLVFLAFWRSRSRWKAASYLIAGYLVVADFAGLLVYQWVPAQYTRDMDWSWPPSDSRSLGLVHGKYRSIAADQGISGPSWVYEERGDFFRGWLLGPTLAGILPVFLTIAGLGLVDRSSSTDGRRRSV